MALGAIFSFASWIYITLLVICSAAYTHTCWLDPAASLQGMKYSSSSESNKHGIKGMVFKLARVGERQSLLVSLSLVAMAIHTICF